jgi:predicted phage terminase large subunit-like protein
MELWDMFLRDEPFIAAAAPRGHAKSTAITHAYGLANLLFRKASHLMIVSSSEGQSVQFLNDIKMELLENEDLRELFGVDKFLKENEKEIVVQMKDRHRFRVVAKGAGQRLRGGKWMGKRPDLIICDDLEDDEIVMNQERRRKFKTWFNAALLPMLSKHGKMRVVGTILHLDSLLENLLSNDGWLSKRFAAHNEDYSEILWPEQYPRERLERLYANAVSMGMPEVYYQEYLNVPIDPHNAYFKETDFLAIPDDLWEKPRIYYAAADFAISSNSRADRTVITVGGVDADGYLNIEHVAIGRWDSKEIIDEILAVQARYDVDIFTFEAGAIEKALGPYLETEMLKRGVYVNINKETPVKDKEQRAQSFRARMRAGGVRFDKDTPWYEELHQELLSFPRGKHDDIVDSLAWLGLTLNKFAQAPTIEEQEDMDWEEEFGEFIEYEGISEVTGY